MDGWELPEELGLQGMPYELGSSIIELESQAPRLAADCKDCKDPNPRACSNCHHVVEGG